ncbi:hypothetical protein MUU74_08775 [Chryseobacterium daecheongense]|uniref:hypothetical protein n=1 Tax=Chryseobacterium daecheongense TaxID=192389 RepID=UPI001FD6A316|nr:hypothetical protein [Chryseobacterium daecheongense]UOV00034.1 hypothetical protein MUU74_08775 [Chryseobacterium daecheongense]
MTKKIFPVVLLTGSFAFAQVGINTESPKATLEVAGTPTDNTKYDGIIAPRITGDQLKAKNYSASQTGALVYITSADSAPSGQTLDVTSPGYYYFNGDSGINKWIKLSTGISATLEPWNVQNTANPATANNQNIYQSGKVGIGFTAGDAVSDKQFEVKGDMKAHHGSGSNYWGIDTSLLGVGSGMYYSDNNDLSLATSASVVMTRPGISSLQSNNGQGGGSIATFSSPNGGSFGLVANNSDQTVNASVWGQSDASANYLYFSHGKTSAESTILMLEKMKGATFIYNNASGIGEGNYTFPRTNGTANQVLVSDGATNAQLSWKDASALPQKIRTLASGTVAVDDYTVLITGDISLPAANTSNLGKIYNLINDTSGPVTVAGTFRINGGTFSNYGLNNTELGRGIVVQSTGSAWVLISRY